MLGSRRVVSVVVAMLGLGLVVVASFPPQDADAQVTEPTVRVDPLLTSAYGRGATTYVHATSPDGRFVVFGANDGYFTDDERTGNEQAYLLDRDSGAVELISRAEDGTPGDADVGLIAAADVSDDGRYVVYQSVARNIVPVDPADDESGTGSSSYKVFLHDRDTDETIIVSRTSDGTVFGGFTPSISGDGARVVITTTSDLPGATDTNGTRDSYLYEVDTGAFTLVSARRDGTAAGVTTTFTSGLGTGHGRISGDGGTVVFASAATDILAEDTTAFRHVFAFDVASGAMELVSDRTGAGEHDGFVGEARPSEGGNRVVFLERGAFSGGVLQPNVLDDTGDPAADLLVKNLDTGELTTVTVGPGDPTAEGYVDQPGPETLDIDQGYGFSVDGRYLAFSANDPAWDTTIPRFFVHDLETSTTIPLHDPEPDGTSFSVFLTRPAAHPDLVDAIYTSSAGDLVTPDVGTARTLFSSTFPSAEGPSVGLDTERLVFGLFDEPDGDVSSFDVTPDGRFVAFISNATDLLEDFDKQDNASHVYVLDRTTGEIELLTVDADGVPLTQFEGGSADDLAGIAISADGNEVVFGHSGALDPAVDPADLPSLERPLYLRDRTSDTTQLVSFDADAQPIRAQTPSVSDDGRYVAFQTSRPVDSNDANLATDVVVRDRIAGTNVVVSRPFGDSPSNSTANWASNDPHLSGDGSTVVFDSRATDLVAGDVGAGDNVYAHDLASRETTLLSALPDGTPSDGDNVQPRVSRDGTVVVFREEGDGGPHNLEPSDDGSQDLVVRTPDGAIEVLSVAPDADVDADFIWNFSDISADGRQATFIAEGSGSWATDGNEGLFLRDRDTERTIRLDLDVDPLGRTFPLSNIDGHAAIDGRSTIFVSGRQLYLSVLEDGVAPTWPAGSSLSSSATGQTVTTLDWDAATDDVGVDAYQILQDDELVGEVDGGTRSLTVSGLTPDTSYTFAVVSVDAAGNATPGPSTTVTTLTESGAATLIAEAQPGGLVSLTWDPASDVDGYRILRDDGGGFVTVADVGSDQLSYTDRELPAATTLTYRVDAVVAETAQPHTDPTTVTTPALALDDVRWDGPRNRGLRLLLGEAITIEADGEPNRLVTADVTVLTWGDGSGGVLDTPAEEVRTIALLEGEPGAYAGQLALDDGTAQVVGVTATLADGSGGQTDLAAAQEPVEVTGTLDVTLDTTGGDVTDGDVIAFHPTAYGSRTAVTVGPGPFALTGLTPADGYELRLVGPDGDDLALDAPPTDVLPGRIVTQELVVSLPASLAVDLNGSEGTPLGTVRIHDSETDAVLGQDAVGRDGMAGPFDALVSGRGVTVTFEPNGTSLHDMAELSSALRLESGDNLLEAVVPRPPLGVLQGTVVEDANGLPVAGASVSFTFDYLERWKQLTATTDAQGQFRLEPPSTVGELTVRPGAAPRVVRSGVEITAGVTTEIEVRTPPTRPIEVELDLFTQLPGGELVQAPMYRQQASHFHVTTVIDGDVDTVNGYPLRRVVGLDATSVEVCADGWEVGLPKACDQPTIGDDDVARGRIELVWPGAAVATLHGPDGSPIPDDLAWSAAVREPVADGHRILDRHAGRGPDATLPLREFGTYSIDVITVDGERTVLSATATSNTPTVELGVVELAAPGPFATFIGETEKNLDQPGSDVAIVQFVPGPDGWMDVRVELENTGAAVTDARLRLEQPSGAEPRSDAATVDGADVTSSVADRTLEVPLGSVGAGGQRTVRVRLPVAESIPDRLVGVRAFVDSSAGTEFVGRDDRPLEPITLQSPPTVRTDTFTVGGLTRPAGVVHVVDDRQTSLGTAVADANGRWRTTITLPDRGRWFRHRISAELEDGAGAAVTDPVAVEIDETMPEIASVTMSQPDREVDFVLGDDPFVFPFTFNPSYRLGFEVTFVNPDQVRDPVVAVGRSAAPLVRRADGVFVASMTQWSSGLGPVWITNDHAVGPAIFDRPAPTQPEIESWIPQLEDAEIGEPVFGPTVSALASPMGSDEPLAQRVVAALAPTPSSPEVIPVQTAANSASWSDTHSVGGGGTYDIDIEVTTQDDYVLTAADAAREEYSGLPIYAPSVSGSVTATTIRGSANFKVPLDIVTDADGTIDQVALRTMVASVLNDGEILRDDGTVVAGPQPPVVLANAGTVVKVAEVSLEVFMTVEDTRSALGVPDVADQIAQQRARAYGCDGPAGPRLQGAADALRARFFGAEAVKFGMGIAAGGLAATGIGAIPAAGLGVISYAMGNFIDDETAGLIDDVTAEIDAAYAAGDCDDDGDDDDGPDDDGSSSSSFAPVREWEPTTPEGHHGKCILLAETIEELNSCPRDGDAPEPEAEPVWIHDPSGYVFEAVPSNRLEGVTATVLHAPAAEGPWTAWDAEWFGQDNPQTTDADGRYGWDVPEGWWKVRYEADGYRTGESEVLEVLPPHFDVNVGLVDPTPPGVDVVRVTSDGSAIDVVFDRYMIADDLDTTSVQLQDGSAAAVPVELAYPDAETDLDGRLLTTTVRLTPQDGLEPGATYTVDVGSLARSYAGTPLTADLVRQVTVAPNTVPQASADAYPMNEDQRLVVTAGDGVLVNDDDADGHDLQAVLDDGPAFGRLELAADGSFVYDPVADMAGVVSFSYRATDGTDVSDAVTVTLTIAAGDDAPRPVDDGYTTTAGESLAEGAPGVLANDLDDGELRGAVVTASPNSGTLEFTGDGAFTYTPEAGFVGTDRFAYRVWDGRSLSAAAWVSVEVSAEPSPPRRPTPGLPDWVTCPAVSWPAFPDVPADSTHADAVGCLAALELVRGFEDGSFGPAEPITRAQFASVLDRALAASGITLPDASHPFGDVQGTHADAIGRLTGADIIGGRSATEFAPEAPVTRGQVMSLLMRAADAYGLAFPDAGEDFLDTGETTHGDAIARARRATIASGYVDGTFRPDQVVRRDQAASLLARWFEWNASAG